MSPGHSYRHPAGLHPRRSASGIVVRIVFWVALAVVIVAAGAVAYTVINQTPPPSDGSPHVAPDIDAGPERSPGAVEPVEQDAAAELDTPDRDASPDSQTRFTAQPAPAAEPVEPYRVPAGRSPLLQPGEHLDALIPAKRLETAPERETPDPQVIPWASAYQHVGKTVTIQGEIVDAHNTGSVCFLNFVPNVRQGFYVILFKDVLDAWPAPPEKHFLNATVQVTGEVQMRGKRPQIQVHRADQIKKVAPAPTED